MRNLYYFNILIIFIFIKYMISYFYTYIIEEMEMKTLKDIDKYK